MLNANANNGLPFLLDNTPGATAEINLLRSMGARAVTVNMAFPIVTQDFYGYNGDPQDYAKVLAFYQNIATQVHRAGMKLIVEAALVYPATPGMNIRGYYDSLSDAQFIAGRAKNLLVMAQQIQPDFLNLNSEPDTELVNSGGKSDEYGSAQAFAALNQSNISQLRAAGITIPLGVGVGTWSKSQSGGAADWVAALVKISGLSFFDIHVYPVTGDYLPNLIAYTEQAQAAGLPVSMAKPGQQGKFRGNGLLSFRRRTRSTHAMRSVFGSPSTRPISRLCGFRAMETLAVYLSILDPMFLGVSGLQPRWAIFRSIK